MTSIIHINRNVIQQNAKRDVKLPVCRVQQGTKTRYGMEVVLYDKDHNEVGRLIYRPDSPLKCGAKLWIEYHEHIEILGEQSWSEMSGQS